MATTHPVVSEREWRERVVAYSCGDASAAEQAAVEAHLAECPACREALAAYDRFDMLARSPLRLDGVEPASVLADAPREASEPEAALSVPARSSSPEPDIRPLPAWQAPYFAQRLMDAARSRAYPALPTISAVLAASLILVAFAALLLPRLHGGPTEFAGYAPNTAGIAMVSAAEGWAAGNGLLWHYKDGRWGNVPDPFVDSGGGSQWFGMPGEGIDLQAFAPNDIWSGYGRSIYHFDGQQWRISYSLPSTDATIIRSVSMSSPDDGWAVGMNINTQGPAVLRCTAGTWKHVSLDSDSQASAMELWHVTAISANEAWASGEVGPQSTSAQASPVLLHYIHGQWQQVPLPGGMTFLGKITMTSSNDGWMPVILDEGTPAKISGMLLRYRNGTWSIARKFGPGTWMNEIAMVSPTQGWAVGSGLWRYANGTWSSVPLPTGVTGAGLESLSLISMDEGWAGGYGLMLQLHGGVWTRYGKAYPQQAHSTPTPIPACAAPAISTRAIRPGGFGAPWVSLLDRWGRGRAADGGGEYLGAYADTGTPRTYVDNAGIAAQSVTSLVYLVDNSQQLSLQDARNLAASMLPRDATLYPAGNAWLEPPDGAAEVYCSPALLHIQQAAFQPQQQNIVSAGFIQPPTGMIFVTFVARNDGGVDRIVFSS